MKENPTSRNFSSHDTPPISFAEALSVVASHSDAILSSRGIETEYCDLSGCLGRVLADPLAADRDQPPFDRATRDGFAVRSQDIAVGTPLRIAGQLRAGESWPSDRAPLQPREAIEIMTGAPLPHETDAVLMVEHTQRSPDAGKGVTATGESNAWILPQPDRTLRAGENVVPRGSEARQGQVLIEPGTRLGPDSIGLAASCGRISLEVYRVPSVAILTTGDEIVELAPRGRSSSSMADAIMPHQIYDSNSHSLAALVRQANAIALPQPAARDMKTDLAARIQDALSAAPLLLLTGGVSMGRYDLVEEVLAEMGAEFYFTGVRIQPGKPVVFGRVPARDGHLSRYVFGLPGNPVSTMVTFRVFVRPLLAALAGERHWQPQIALARLTAAIQCKPGLTRFLPAHLDTADAAPTVTPIKTQGSGDLAANARANCYAIVPEDCEELAAGETVRLLLR